MLLSQCLDSFYDIRIPYDFQLLPWILFIMALIPCQFSHAHTCRQKTTYEWERMDLIHYLVIEGDMSWHIYKVLDSSYLRGIKSWKISSFIPTLWGICYIVNHYFIKKGNWGILEPPINGTLLTRAFETLFELLMILSCKQLGFIYFYYNCCTKRYFVLG